MKMTRRNFLSASALTLLSCQLAPAARADCLLSDLFHGADTALPPKPLTAKVMDANPFMGRSESNIHHDCYNTDSTDAILPVGICPEVNVAMEKTNPTPPRPSSSTTSITPSARSWAVWPSVTSTQKKSAPSAFSLPPSTTEAAISSKAPIPLWTGATSSSAPPATTMC